MGLIDPTLSKPQLRQTRLWLASPLVGLPVRHLCLSELTPEAVELGPHVISGAEGRLARRLGQPVACPLHLRHGIRPRTAEQHQLGAVDQALAAVEHQLRLRVAPAAERRRPLLGPTHVEHLLAPLDHRAVEVSDRRRGHLVRRDRHHRLVEQRHALGDLSAIDQAPALTDPGQCDELRVAEPITDLGCLHKARVGGLDVAFERQSEGGAVAQVSLLDTISLTVVQQPLRPVDPPAATGQLTLVQQNEGQPEGATGGAGDLTGLHVLVVRTRPCVDAVVDPANEVRSRREPLQILELQMRVAFRGRQLRERVPPRPPSKRLTTSIDRVGHGHSLVHSAYCSPPRSTPTTSHYPRRSA